MKINFLEKIIVLSSFITLILFSENAEIHAQITSAEAGFIDAVVDFDADNTGQRITTRQLQDAINAATSQNRPLFIPAGTYLVDNSLIVEDGAAIAREQNTFITGSSVDPDNRTVIVLKAGSFNTELPRRQVILHRGWSTEQFANTFHRVIQNIDIKIEENNPGAIGLRWRGAEGVAIFDVNIDATGAFAGMEMLPGSGGSAANISVTGGKYGIYLDGTTQPTPTITGITMQGQTFAAIHSYQTRGSLTITGGKFMMNNKVPVFMLERINYSIDQSTGGNPVLTDCIIEYSSPDNENQVIKMPAGRDQSVYFSDVYVKNAGTILSVDATVNSNPNGWRHFRKFAYNSGWNEAASLNGNETIYVDGASSDNIVFDDFVDDATPPANIIRKHTWGNTFPGFETSGVVNVADYSSLVDNNDWSPAFNAAIEAAEANGSNVVFVPVGDYIIYNTIHLKKHTALVGAGFKNSRILGRDDEGRRFGGSTNSWTDPKPMIQTPDDKSATCILADIGINVNGPFNGDSHTPESMACYAILWRAGNNSIIRNIDYMHERRSAYRTAWSLVDSLTTPSWLNLRSLPSPYTINDIIFESESAHGYHISEPVPSRILLETVNDSKRFMTRSLPPALFNNTTNNFDIPNLTISKTGEQIFGISTLKVANAAWNPAEGTDITITGFGNDDPVHTISLKNISREDVQTIDLNWTNLTKVVITSEVPFSIDEVVIDGEVVNFRSEEGEMLTEGVDFNHWCSAYGYYYLPIFFMAHPYVVIEGGVKYYNHWKHGTTWLRITEPYVMVRDNDPDHIVSFYHAHAQHSQNFYKFKIQNAHNVSLFGVKTENALEFARVENSNNIRLMGHGGLTNTPRGTAHYRFENSTNYKVVSPSNEVETSHDQCRNCRLGNAMLPRTMFGTYEVIQEVYNDVYFAPDQTDLPILFMRGNPIDPWETICDDYVELSVEGGTGSNFYCAGIEVTINAIIPEHLNFSHWAGDTQYLDDSTKANPIVTIPDKNISLEATFNAVSVGESIIDEE